MIIDLYYNRYIKSQDNTAEDNSLLKLWNNALAGIPDSDQVLSDHLGERSLIDYNLIIAIESEGLQNSDVRENIARHPNTSTEILDRLSYDNNNDVRYFVARNPNTSTETLDRLSYDDDDVRHNVAQNPNTSIETLERLSYDGDNRVRRDLAQNPNTSIEILDRLSYDNDYGVRVSAIRELSRRRGAI